MTLPNLYNLPPTIGMDTWKVAQNRTNSYLKLHGLENAECERVLKRINHKLSRQTSSCQEKELLRLFITAAQEELAALQKAQSEKYTSCSQRILSLDTNHAESRIKTGPRFERSSIRVAPLQSISLLPTRARLLLEHH